MMIHLWARLSIYVSLKLGSLKRRGQEDRHGDVVSTHTHTPYHGGFNKKKEQEGEEAMGVDRNPIIDRKGIYWEEDLGDGSYSEG